MRNVKVTVIAPRLLKGGRENEIPYGVNADGEVDMDAYEAWQQAQHVSQHDVRREEVNINHHQSPDIDMEL